MHGWHITLPFQHTAARRRLLDVVAHLSDYDIVSTHSRPKAAAAASALIWIPLRCFNTQPPEGGCRWILTARRVFLVSTHSRPKAAAFINSLASASLIVSTHSRPKAAARRTRAAGHRGDVSTHSRPKAAASAKGNVCRHQNVSTHSRPKAAAGHWWRLSALSAGFQHTAARRRLLRDIGIRGFPNPVSTHSRPKAAATGENQAAQWQQVSTHSRPKAAAIKTP